MPTEQNKLTPEQAKELVRAVVKAAAAPAKTYRAPRYSYPFGGVIVWAATYKDADKLRKLLAESGLQSGWEHSRGNSGMTVIIPCNNV